MTREVNYCNSLEYSHDGIWVSIAIEENDFNLVGTDLVFCELTDVTKMCILL